MSIDQIAGIDRVLHEPSRLLLVAHLFAVERTDFVFLMRQTGMTGGNVSSHMSKLEAAGYIEIEKTFQGRRPQTRVRLTKEGRKAFVEYKSRMSQFLQSVS